MYILIELVPEAGGSGFGIFFCVLLGLAFLFIMAQYAMTWLLAPAAIVMTLLQNETLWWILPTLLVVGVVVNWLFATSKAWFPFMPALLTLVLVAIFWVVGLIVELIIKSSRQTNSGHCYFCRLVLRFMRFWFTRYSI